MSKFNFLSIGKTRNLQELVGWLETIKPSQLVIHVITNTDDREDWNVEKTNQLHELQVLNQRREELIKKIIE